MLAQTFTNKLKKFNLSFELVTGVTESEDPFHALVIFAESDIKEIITQQKQNVNIREYGKVIFSKAGHDVSENEINNMLSFY